MMTTKKFSALHLAAAATTAAIVGGVIGVRFFGSRQEEKASCCVSKTVSAEKTAEPAATPAVVKNTAILFIKPHANNSKVQALVAKQLKDMGFKVLAQKTVSAKEIESNSHAAKHYYAIASKAGYVPTFNSPEQLNVPKDKFKAKFGVDYDAEVAAKRVLSAKAACEYLGLTKAELDEMNFKEKKAGNLIKFGGGFYCGKLPGKTADESVFVFNAFCGNMLDAYVAADSQGVTLFKVEWDEKTLSWDDFRAQKLGPTDPSKAPADSLRGAIYAQWEELGLAKQPNTGLNGVHGSASPFEAMAEVENWLGESLDSQSFYKALLAAGVSAKQVDEWKYEAQIKLESGKMGSSFDVVEDTNSSDCLATLAKLAALN